MSQFKSLHKENEKTLYLHTGTHKTGSTALQAYLASNKDRLESLNISYEFPLDADQSVGNGQLFYKTIKGYRLQEQDLEELLSFYFAGRSVSILSSEDFTCFGKGEWLQIKDTCQRLGITVKIITYVRNIAQYYTSLYGQLVKGGEILTSIDSFYTQNQYYNVIDSLRNMLEIFGRDAMSLIHYETFFDKLDFAFMAALDLPSELFNRSVLLQPVNRTLIEYELEILKSLNEAIGNQYSYELSSVLMCENPYLSDTNNIDQNTVNMLNTRHVEDVQWVNLTFFDGEDTLKIYGQPYSKFANTKLTPDIQQSIDRTVINWAIQKMKSVQSEVRQRLVARLIDSVLSITISDPDLPTNFDPIAYLLLNSDVLFADMDPCLHYKSSGRQEGRAYKLSDLYLRNQTTTTGLAEKKQFQQFNDSLTLLTTPLQTFCYARRSPYSELQFREQNSQDYVKRQEELMKLVYPPFMSAEYKNARTGTTLVVVLGMHRSGTSTLTRALQVFGVELGEQLMQALPDNPKGFWEDLDLNKLNMDMLEDIGQNWYSLSQINAESFSKLLKSNYFQKAVSLLCQKTESRIYFGFKDPRVAKLLPFWKIVFTYCGFNVHYIIALRNPLSVCNSLTRRDNFSHPMSYALWVNHLLECLQETAEENRLIVDYDRLMDSPEVELERISKQLNLPIIAEHKTSFIQDFLENSLRHTVSSQEDLDSDPFILPLSREMYAFLVKGASDCISANNCNLNELSNKWAVEFARQRPLLLLIDQLFQQTLNNTIAFDESSKLVQSLAERDNQLRIYEQELLTRASERTELESQINNLTKLATSADAYGKSLAQELESVHRMYEQERAVKETERIEVGKHIDSLKEWAVSADVYGKTLVQELDTVRQKCEIERQAWSDERAVYRDEISHLSDQIRQLHACWYVKIFKKLSKRDEL